MKTFFIFIPLFISFQLFAAFNFSELTSKDLLQLHFPEKILVKAKTVKKAPWPEMNLFSVIDTSPQDAIAIFSTYSHQKYYIPNMIKSTPVKKVGPNNTYVSYEFKAPWPLTNTLYTTANVTQKVGKNTYMVKWYLVSSKSLKDTHGSILFIPYKGKTLMRYSSFIHPESIFASLIKGLLEKNLLKTVESIKSHIETLSKEQPKIVELYKNKLFATIKK